MPFDRSKYPPNWPTIRATILRRAGRVVDKYGKIIEHARCELCGAVDRSVARRGPKRNPRYVTIVLTTMHLNHDPENWDVQPHELAAGCQRCHWHYDHPAKPRDYSGNRPPRARARIARTNQRVTINDVRGMNAPQPHTSCNPQPAKEPTT